MKKAYGLSDQFMKDIAQMGYQKPTPVQIGAVPILMAKRNAMILAETGSGKSLAFILPLSEMIKRGDGL